MLDPRDRSLLLESLRPPEGYRLDHAVGTSYSLDLIALLVAPLAFTYFDWEDEEGRTVADPLALLESVRRHADRIRVFCQAGEIKLPPPTQRLVAYLERSVVPVRAPNPRGIFHPKVWLVRYVADGEPVRYRFLCLTRNLTFDRCWDTMLCLDGTLLDRKNAVRANHPLGDFIAALPGMALQPMSEADAANVRRMADEVRRVQFDLPVDMDGLAFHPLGIPGYSGWPFHLDRARRPVLILSPFVSASLLVKLTEQREDCTLVTRPDQLAALPPDIVARFREVFALSPTAEDPEDDRDAAAFSSLAGLHAKLFIEDDGWNAHVYTGSANATNAAFESNVEFVVELIGKKGRIGINSFLGDPETKKGIRPLLTAWVSNAIEPSEEQRIREELDAQLVSWRRALACHPMALKCGPTEDGANRYRLVLRSDTEVPEEIRAALTCWPAMLRSDVGKRIDGTPGILTEFGPMALDAVTAFLACELSITQSGVTCTSRFVLNLPLAGLPEDRLQRLLAAQMQNAEQLLRLLFLLIDASTSAVHLQSTLAGTEMVAPGQAGWAQATLFERMVRGLVDAPRSVAEAGRLIDELDRTEEGRAVVPEALRQLWSQLKVCLGDTRESA